VNLKRNIVLRSNSFNTDLFVPALLHELSFRCVALFRVLGNYRHCGIEFKKWTWAM